MPPALSHQALRARLAPQIAQARATFPGVALDDDAFAAYVATKLGPDGDADALRVADLFLAFACAEGDAKALAAFDKAHAADVRRAFARARANGIALEDFEQALRQKLFAQPAPKIREYGGTGHLRGWVRVVATRTLLDMARPAHLSERPSADDAFLKVPAPADAPDLAYLKRLYSSEVEEAMKAAAASLTPEERNFLREHYAQGLSVDQIGQLHGVHRATAARRVQRAREALLARVHEHLASRLRLSEAELASVLRLVQSEIHVTLERVLR